MSTTLGELLGDKETITREQIEAVVATGPTLPDTFSLLLADKLPEAERKVDHAVARYRAIYAEHANEWTTLYPGVAHFLNAAHSKEIALTVVSNKGELALHASLNALGIADYFTLILGEQEDLRPKPAPDVFDRRIAPAFKDIPRSEMLFVGDTPADLAFAKTVGIDACWAAYGHGDRKACLLLDPVCVIDGFDHLAMFVGLEDSTA